MGNVNLFSIMSLYIKMKFGNQILSTGTGFLVSKNDRIYLVTNRHNVTGRNQISGGFISKTGGVPDRIEILHVIKGLEISWGWREEFLYDGEIYDGNFIWIEHPELGERVDVVLLPLKNIDDIRLNDYREMGQNSPAIQIYPSSSVSIIGYPFGLNAIGSKEGGLAIWVNGFVATDPDLNYQDLPCFLVDCRTRSGQSGSPVIAYRGPGLVLAEDNQTYLNENPVHRLLGVYSGRITEDSDIGIVWKVSVIIDILQSL